MMNSIYKTGYKIQVSASTSNTYGGFGQIWADDFTISGYLRELSGDEILAAAQKQLYSTHRFYCDTASITEKKRLVDPDNNIYDIRFVVQKNTGSIKFTQLDAKFTGEVAT